VSGESSSHWMISIHWELASFFKLSKKPMFPPSKTSKAKKSEGERREAKHAAFGPSLFPYSVFEFTPSFVVSLRLQPRLARDV
jgi:hypothetical protein